MNYSKQVEQGHYKTGSYDTLSRFISYFLQKECLFEVVKPDSTILEIGKGNGFFSEYIKRQGLKIASFDIAEDLHPDYVGDLVHIKDFVQEKFDVVCCFEVLEHLEWKDTGSILKQLSSISNEYVLISLPQVRFYFSFWFKIPKLSALSSFLSIPFPVSFRFNGEHHWELGVKGSSRNNFRSLVREAGLNILKEFTLPLDPYHRFFVCKKSV